MRDLILRIPKWVEQRGPDECWSHLMWEDKDGYGAVMYNRKKWRIHRLMYSLFVDDIKEGNVIRHTCDNPKCCNPLHLEQGTQKDNINDAITRDRKPIGERMYNAKLREEEVKHIRTSTAPPKHLAGVYGVTRTCITRIRNRQSWKHVT